MALRNTSRSTLEANLREVNERLERHPLASARVKEAQTIVAESQGADKKDISQKLSEKGLPSLDELGSIQLRESVSWWRLNREKNKIEKKLEDL